jgi:hypothetical protein
MTKKKTQKTAEPIDQVRDLLGETFTKDAIERVLSAPVRALGNVTPADAVAVGDVAPVLAWANRLADGNFD